MEFRLKHMVRVSFASLVFFVCCNLASAETMDQAVAACIQQFSPTVRECVRQRAVQTRGNYSAADVEACSKQVRPQVNSCIANRTGAAGLSNSQVGIAKSKTSSSPSLKAGASPPRTIADITAILDQEKPDPERLRKLQASADASEPAGSNVIAKAHFYYGRALVRAEVGRFRESVADAERAVELATGKVDQYVLSSYRQTAALQYTAAGEPKLALKILEKMADDGERGGERGFLFTVYRNIAITEITLGNFERAQSYMVKLQELGKVANLVQGFSSHGNTWLSNVEEIKGRLAEALGQFEEAVGFYQRAEQLRRGNIEKSATAIIPVPRNILELAADLQLLSMARVKARLGRVAEAESDARRALLNRLQANGKYNPTTARFVAAFGSLLIEQGRYAEARKLMVATIDIYRAVGVAEDSQVLVANLSSLASIEALEGRWREAEEAYGAVQEATKNWEVGRREGVLLTHGYIETLYKTRKSEEGLAAAQRLLAITRSRNGNEGPDTVLAQGHYAAGLALVRRDEEARKEFQAAVPLLTSATFNTDNDDVLNAAARTRYTQAIVESYIELLARARQAGDEEESLRLAELIRGRSVQKALTASGARMSTSDATLATVVRKEQDLRQQIGTQLGQLNKLLALPAAQRDEAGVAVMRKEIEKLRAEHTKVRADIDRKYPEYAELIDPKPPTLTQIKEILRPDERLLSFYFGREASFAWVLSKDRPLEFATLSETIGTIETKVTKLREALEPQATMVSDIPKFDLALSHELYRSLLEPVKRGWEDAKQLIVVTNGALGLLPLSVLTTSPHDLADGEPIFSGYRTAPWLARSHAVSLVPSASALRTLRRLPPGSEKRRGMIGFGDPFFNATQANEGDSGNPQVADASQTRGIPLRRRAGPQTSGVDSAGLAELPRLPDTADELRSIAIALQVDPTKALNLGREANEQKVKTTNLSGFKIIVFATHGLVPGELDGLTQPALALTAPAVAGVEGDGLLTMEEILALKLDADWVVLSACNTGAAAGSGAEAASGLGRAFFYAGTRAILVTNWSVHSQSARELVTDLFRRQAADSKLSRAESLRQAMMALLDQNGFTDQQGQIVFTYAHPLFWAPYTVIGDGG
jgi:CHAT domain-containing protein